MFEQQIFNFEAAGRAKREGMKRAIRSEELEIARAIAESLAQTGPISMDDVMRELIRQGYGIDFLGNSAGSVFADRKKWEWTGELIKSSRVRSHQNLLRTWKLKK